MTIENRPAAAERPLTEVVTQLSKDLSLLVRQEVGLAKREAAEKLRALLSGVASAAIGGLILHIGALALTAALILLLGQAVPAWLAALIVGVVYVALGALLLRQGTSRLREVRLEPEKSAENLKRDVEAIKHAAH